MKINSDDILSLVVIVPVILFILIAMLVPRFSAPQECWSAQDPQLCKAIIERGHEYVD